MKKFIIDVSTHQKEIDWAKIKSQNVEGAILRVAYTGWGSLKTYIDAYFERNYSKVRAVSLPVGVYLYSSAITEDEAIKEAQFVLKTLKGRHLDYPIFFDMEETNRTPVCQTNVGKAQMSKVANAFCNHILNNSKYMVGVYSFEDFLENSVDMSTVISQAYVWVAHYGQAELSYKGRYDMWQYSSTKVLDGVSGHDGMVDTNFLYVDFNTDQETEIKETMLLKCIKVSTSKGYPYRNKAGGAILGYYKVGDTIKVTNAYSYKKVANVGSADAWFIDDKGNHFAFDKDYFN